ncbi:UDP-N-acetylmuramoylalanine--D-glutamate ligase [hydrothermal vent metagenome]|uniref:UDP-N-acetylmuramoylalanine--D-glutamate ligase n=1 Tax=hydrothermal vent metagenome TaxID=652676 RepID=A0A3B1DSG5_9ZZZZ
MRILGRGKTALAIQKLYPNTILYDNDDFDKFDKKSEELTIVSPGIPPHNKLVKNTLNLISEYDLFCEVMPYSIWISGTNGKTTTTRMLQHLLKDHGSICGGNIGTPLSSMNKYEKIWILETSSFMLHYTKKAKPNIYVLLPINDDHLSWHGSFEEYEKSKLKPLKFLKEGEIAIVPSKYKEYPTNGYKIYYDDISTLEKVFNLDSKLINLQEPFMLDALLSLAVTRILFDEVDYKKINTFKQDSHKLEKFYDNKNRLWIDDSKATNIDATIQALKSYKNHKIYLILGGDDKGANLNVLFDELVKYDITLFSIGLNANKLNELSVEFNIKCYVSNILENAIISIYNNKEFNIDNCVALLSPSAASLDQFSSYKHRGEMFKAVVRSLS